MRSVCSSLAAVLLATALAACTASAPRSPHPARPQLVDSTLPSSPVSVPLHPYFRGLRTVRVTSGADTLTFLLDTGGGHTLLTVEAARKLGCAPFGRQTAYRMSGERVDFRWCAGVPLSVGGVPLEHPVVAVFDLMALLPSALPPLDGVLSLQSFRERVVTLDHAGAKLVLESGASAAVRAAAMRQLTARAATGEDGGVLSVFVAARAEGAPVWLLLDSGNLVGTVLAPHAARQLGVAAPDGAAGAEGAEVRVPLEVLGLALAREPVVIRELIIDGALGVRFFEQGAVMLDFRGGRVRAYRSAAAEDAGT